VFSREEARYHEAIATVPMQMVRHPARIAILGGGDGLAARNVLRFASAREVTLVELDRAVLDLWSTVPELVQMNAGALHDPRLHVVVGDAMRWLERARGRFDLIIHDFEMTFTRQPTPITAGRLFAFFDTLRAHLSPGGIAVVTVPEEFDDRLVQGVFDAVRDQLPDAVQQDYRRRRSMEGRVAALFGSLFPHVSAVRLDLPVLGPHTNYYLGNAPMRIRRAPPAIP
jgi:predicted membrane-bound spermidine synthase